MIKNKKKILGILGLLLTLTSCLSNYGELGISVNFPKTSPILTIKEKEVLKEKIKIKNAELFVGEEGVLEVVIK